MTTATSTIQELANREYKYGFVTDVEADTVPPGLNEDIIRHDLGQEEGAGLPAGMASQGLPPLADDGGAALVAQHPLIAPIDYQDIIYYSAPSRRRSSTASTKSIRRCGGPSRSWASRWTSRSG